MKTYYCSLCHKERNGNIKSDITIVCWECLHKLDYTPTVKIRQLSAVFKKKGNKDLAHILDHYASDNLPTRIPHNGVRIESEEQKGESHS